MPIHQGMVLWRPSCCMRASSCCFLSPLRRGCEAKGRERTAVEGHVLHADSQTKLPGVMVMAWPCGLATATDAAGSFRVSCPHGIDSLTVSLVGFHTQVVVEPQGHVDVGLVELAVTLGQVRVSATRFAEAEARGVDRIDLLQSLDATPGLQSLDLGAGMIQPVVRGLYGTRVAVLEDGVPQQGGRWGSDHGILVAPELQVAVAWVPGGGHAWMGPDAVGGGLRFQSPSRLNSPRIQTNIGTTVRVGNPRGMPCPSYALHGRPTLARWLVTGRIWLVSGATTAILLCRTRVSPGNGRTAQHGGPFRPCGAWL